MGESRMRVRATPPRKLRLPVSFSSAPANRRSMPCSPAVLRMAAAGSPRAQCTGGAGSMPRLANASGEARFLRGAVVAGVDDAEPGAKPRGKGARFRQQRQEPRREGGGDCYLREPVHLKDRRQSGRTGVRASEI